jgi:hypothetical protein
MIRIEDSLNELVSSGVISVETAKAFADDPRVIGHSARQPVPATQASPVRNTKGSVRNLFTKKGP